MSSDSADQNADATPESVSDTLALRDTFTFNNTIVVPDRGTITITIDSSTPGLAFTASDADGNLLGDGVLSDLNFTIDSFHINQQPDTPTE